MDLKQLEETIKAWQASCEHRSQLGAVMRDANTLFDQCLEVIKSNQGLEINRVDRLGMVGADPDCNPVEMPTAVGIKLGENYCYYTPDGSDEWIMVEDALPPGGDNVSMYERYLVCCQWSGESIKHLDRNENEPYVDTARFLRHKKLWIRDTGEEEVLEYHPDLTVTKWKPFPTATGENNEEIKPDS